MYEQLVLLSSAERKGFWGLYFLPLKDYGVLLLPKKILKMLLLLLLLLLLLFAFYLTFRLVAVGCLLFVCLFVFLFVWFVCFFKQVTNDKLKM